MVSFAVQKLLSLIRYHLFIFIFITVEGRPQKRDIKLFFRMSQIRGKENSDKG